MSAQLDELKALHPVFEFKNKSSSMTKTVPLHQNSVQVAPRGVLKLRSSEFTQLPSTADFVFIKPSLDDLRAVGLISTAVVQPTPSVSDAE